VAEGSVAGEADAGVRGRMQLLGGGQRCSGWGQQQCSGAMTPGAGGFWGRRGEALQKERGPMTRCGHGTRASFGLWGLDVFQKASRNRANLLRSCRHPRAPAGTPFAQQSPLPTETAGRLLPPWLLPLAAAASHLTPQRWCSAALVLWRSGMLPRPQALGDMSVHGRRLQDKLTTIAYCDLQGAAQAPWPRTAPDPKLAATERARGYLRHCGIVIASSSRQGNQGGQSSQSSPNSSQRRHAMSQRARGGRDTAPCMSPAPPPVDVLGGSVSYHDLGVSNKPAAQ
jgi:hypothetical protein